MQLDLSEDQSFFRETTRRFIAEQTPIDAVRRLHDDPIGHDPEWWRRAAELGWGTMLVDERHGGGCLSGGPLADAVLIAEEMGRALTPGPLVPVNVVAAALSAADGPTAAAIAPLLSGEAIAAWALAEPASTWAPSRFRTTATVDGDDIVVQGAKAYVEAATVASSLLITARGEAGLTQVLVPADAPGVSIRASHSIDLGRRFGRVDLTDVRLPLETVVGEVGGAAPAVHRQGRIAVLLQCADVVGGLDRVFEFTLEYMNDRYAFGRPISSYQALKHRVADLALELETAKACVDAAVAAHDACPVDEPVASPASTEAEIEAAVAKCAVSDTARHLIQECVQFHGGIGVTWEHDLHLYLRRATASSALYGTPEDHRARLCTLLGI